MARDVATLNRLSVQELHTARRIFRRRGCQRVDHHWRFLPLKLVHCANFHPWQTTFKSEPARCMEQPQDVFSRVAVRHALLRRATGLQALAGSRRPGDDSTSCGA